METTTTKANSGYIMLFRGNDWDEGLAPEELRRVMEQFIRWSDSLAKSGKVKGGQALARTGAIVSRGGKTVADGPFAETKEAVGGFLVLDVETLAEAMAIAKTYPGLEFDITIEVRPVLEECPCFKRIRERFGLVPGGLAIERPVKQAA